MHRNSNRKNEFSISKANVCYWGKTSIKICRMGVNGLEENSEENTVALLRNAAPSTLLTVWNFIPYRIKRTLITNVKR